MAAPCYRNLSSFLSLKLLKKLLVTWSYLCPNTGMNRNPFWSRLSMSFYSCEGDVHWMMQSLTKLSRPFMEANVFLPEEMNLIFHRGRIKSHSNLISICYPDCITVIRLLLFWLTIFFAKPIMLLVINIIFHRRKLPTVSYSFHRKKYCLSKKRWFFALSNIIVSTLDPSFLMNISIHPF
jgi:hypothetical protein